MTNTTSFEIAKHSLSAIGLSIESLQLSEPLTTEQECGLAMMFEMHTQLCRLKWVDFIPQLFQSGKDVGVKLELLANKSELLLKLFSRPELSQHAIINILQSESGIQKVKTLFYNVNILLPKKEFFDNKAINTIIKMGNVRDLCDFLRSLPFLANAELPQFQESDLKRYYFLLKADLCGSKKLPPDHFYRKVFSPNGITYLRDFSDIFFQLSEQHRSPNFVYECLQLNNGDVSLEALRASEIVRESQKAVATLFSPLSDNFYLNNFVNTNQYSQNKITPNSATSHEYRQPIRSLLFQPSDAAAYKRIKMNLPKEHEASALSTERVFLSKRSFLSLQASIISMTEAKLSIESLEIRNPLEAEQEFGLVVMFQFYADLDRLGFTNDIPRIFQAGGDIASKLRILAKDVNELVFLFGENNPTENIVEILQSSEGIQKIAFLVGNIAELKKIPNFSQWVTRIKDFSHTNQLFDFLSTYISANMLQKPKRLADFQKAYFDLKKRICEDNFFSHDAFYSVAFSNKNTLLLNYLDTHITKLLHYVSLDFIYACLKEQNALALLETFQLGAEAEISKKTLSPQLSQAPSGMIYCQESASHSNRTERAPLERHWPVPFKEKITPQTSAPSSSSNSHTKIIITQPQTARAPEHSSPQNAAITPKKLDNRSHLFITENIFFPIVELKMNKGVLFGYSLAAKGILCPAEQEENIRWLYLSLAPYPASHSANIELRNITQEEIYAFWQEKIKPFVTKNLDVPNNLPIMLFLFKRVLSRCRGQKISQEFYNLLEQSRYFNAFILDYFAVVAIKHNVIALGKRMVEKITAQHPEGFQCVFLAELLKTYNKLSEQPELKRAIASLCTPMLDGSNPLPSLNQSVAQEEPLSPATTVADDELTPPPSP